MEAYPVSVPIPFTINISTTTKPMRKEETPADGSIFPEPPHSAPELDFKLTRNLEIHAENWEEKDSHKIAMLGGLGEVSGHGSSNAPRVEVLDNAWISDTGHGRRDEKKRKGSWRQETRFRSSFVLTCPPSFVSKALALKVDARRGSFCQLVYLPIS